MAHLRLSILLLLLICTVLPSRAQDKPLPLLPQKVPVHRSGVAEFDQSARAQRSERPVEWQAELDRAASAFRSGVSFLEAKARVDRVIHVLPDDAQARKLRAQILIALNRPEEALTDARHVLGNDPEDGEAHLLISEAATQMGDAENARGAMRAAARFLVEDADLWTRLGRVAVFQEQVTLAQSFAQAAAAADALGARAYYQIAVLLTQRAQEDDAAETLRLGLSEGRLDPHWIKQHPVLAPLARHPRLKSFF